MVELTREHLEWVYLAQRRYFPRVHDGAVDDLVSAGTLALVKAASAYDPARGASFKTYALLRIRGHMRDCLRQLSQWRRNTGAPGLLLVSVNDWTIIESVFGTVCEPIGEYEVTESLQTAIDTLAPREQAAVRLRYLHDMPLADVGVFLGVSESRVSQITTAACRNLRQILDRDTLAA